MKKSTLRIEEQQPRNIQRADIAPEAGYAMVVDGHFKNHFSEESAAKKSATELLTRYPMLQVEIYDATTKARTRVQTKALDQATHLTALVTSKARLFASKSAVTLSGQSRSFPGR